MKHKKQYPIPKIFPKEIEINLETKEIVREKKVLERRKGNKVKVMG